MGEIRDVELGYVSTRRGARLHLVCNGRRAYCGSGTGSIITSRPARSDDATQVCKRCREALRSRLVDVLNVRGRRSVGRPSAGDASIMRSCDSLIDGMEPPAERAAYDAMAAAISETIDASSRPVKCSGPLIDASSQRADNVTLF